MKSILVCFIILNETFRFLYPVDSKSFRLAKLFSNTAATKIFFLKIFFTSQEQKMQYLFSKILVNKNSYF